MDKRPGSPILIPNPLIKKRNLGWTISPDPQHTQSHDHDHDNITTSAVEAGQSKPNDHLALFSAVLTRHTIPSPPPLLPVPDYAFLYTSCIDNPHGAHFVIHQHDHPVAGPHYDLRLQINPTSSVSWAVMYGMPGDPASSRPNRNATETRIHCLWNHIIETASSATGSLLIWDTGTYTVLPREPPTDPSSQSQSHSQPDCTPQQSLHDAFQQRKIRVRLHGSRLPDPYVINLRLTKADDAAGRNRRPARRRCTRQQPQQPETSDSSDSNSSSDPDEQQQQQQQQQLSPMDRELREIEDKQVRRDNAYPGSVNSIGSIHQRRWYLSLDKEASGLTSKHQHQNQDRQQDQHGRLSYPFHVHGPDHERSVVTGRRAADVLSDEGVTNFVRRNGWRPVLS